MRCPSDLLFGTLSQSIETIKHKTQNSKQKKFLAAISSHEEKPFTLICFLKVHQINFSLIICH